MNLTCQTVGAEASLEDLQETLRQSEALDFRVISCCRSRVEGKDANVVLFESVSSTPTPQLSLRRFPNDVSTGELEAALASAAEVVSYGALFVMGRSTNVAILR